MTLVVRLGRLAHLVHPGAAVPLVTTEEDTSLPVDLDVDVEAGVGHLAVNVGPGVVLAEVHAGSVALKTFLNNIGNAAGLGVGALVVPSEPLVVVWQETTLHSLLEDGFTVGDQAAVVLDVLQEEPDGISAVVTRELARSEQVGDHTVLDNRGEAHQVLLGLGISTRAQKETTHGDHDVSAPAAGPVLGKVRKTSGHRRHKLVRPERRIRHVALDLVGNHGQRLEEALAVLDIVVHLLDAALEASLVASADDQCKVARQQERGQLADGIET